MDSSFYNLQNQSWKMIKSGIYTHSNFWNSGRNQNLHENKNWNSERNQNQEEIKISTSWNFVLCHGNEVSEIGTRKEIKIYAKIKI